MATVFLARDIRHDRPVAIKVLHPELAAILGTERFLREVRITARLSHPHILPLLDSGEADGLLYYVMPFVEGISLRARLDREGPLPITEALAIGREVADALGYAHGRGVVHRDIKPENILLESHHALVADFGIARAVDEAAGDRVTATGIAVGTPHYMSPEQMEGAREVDPRSDLYSLGCVLYEMLAGTPPFVGPTPHAIAARRLTTPAPSVRMTRDTVPPEIDAAVHRALARTAADRFQTAAELGAALVTGSHPATAAPPARSPARWTRRAFGVAAVMLVIAAAAAWLAFGRPRGGGGRPESIAVLPFANLSADTAYEYLADGLTDELITSLTMVNGLQVASRTSSFAFKGQPLDLRDIGRRLGVAAVLEGTVRPGNGRVRVTSRLVSVKDGYQRWSESYDRDLDDALAIERAIAASITANLRGQLGSGEAGTRGGTTDPEAYDLYLRGRFYRNKRTEDGIRRAVDLFRQAVAKAPTFARAYLGLAESYAVQGYYDAEPPREVFPAAERAAEEALRQDPDLGSAHGLLGYVALYYHWDFERAEAEFRRAISIEPGYATSHQWYANLLVAAGRFDEAETAARQAIALDPVQLITNTVLGWVLYHRGDLDRALTQFRATDELDPTFALTSLWAGQTLEQAGRLAEAETRLRRAVELSNGGMMQRAALARTLAVAGKTEEARQILATVEQARVVPSFDVAKVHLALGRRADALRWLERAFEERSHAMAFLRVDPQLAGLRGDPAFEALAARVRR